MDEERKHQIWLENATTISRNKAYRAIHEEETRDDDHDGVPDIYQGTRDEKA